MMGLKNLFVKDIHVQVYGTEININLSRFRRNLPEAQRWLTSQVAADCTNFIPFRNGTLRSSVTFPEGLDGGQIEYGKINPRRIANPYWVPLRKTPTEEMTLYSLFLLLYAVRTFTMEYASRLKKKSIGQ